MSDLLKEAIADAKAVRETALQNAKMALEEAFTPQLKNMLSAKLKQEEDAVEGEPVVEDEEMDDEETEEIPIEDGDDMGDDTDGDVNINIDADDDDEEGPEETYEDEEAKEDEVDEDFEIEEDNLDLEAIIKELEDELSEGEHEDEEDEVEEYTESSESSEETVEENEAKEVDAVEEEYEIDEDTLKEEEDEGEVEESNTSELEAELKEYKEAVSFLKDKLHEVNILNAKLLFTNKLFKEFALDNNQKLKVVETFDRAQTTREIKLVYSTLAEQFGDNGSIVTKKSISESASKAVASTKPSKETTKKVISEEVQVADRFRKLAGLIK